MLCSLQRTNPRLTGNIKIVISDSGLFMESIDSSSELQRVKYKGVKYNTDFNYGQNLRKFAANFTNINTFFDVTKEQDVKISSNIKDQYHQRYDYGCYSSTSNIVDGRFRFFAPLHLDSTSLDNLPDDKKQEILRQRFDKEIKRGAGDEKEFRKRKAMNKMLGKND